MLLAAVTMAVLLGVLAVLQYRWVGQLSADERDRMRAHLDTRADGFADDFNRELTRAFFWLQIGAELRQDVAGRDRRRSLRALVRDGAASRSRARDLSGRPRRRDGGCALHRFHRAPARLEPASWPSELAPDPRAARGAGAQPCAADAPPAPPFRVQPVWPEMPALAIPRVQSRRAQPRRA